jgi:hypothetical protein
MNKYWHTEYGKYKQNEAVDAFIVDLFSLYEKHNMSLGHEDNHGSFIVNKNCEYNRDWVKNASVEVEKTNEI